MSNLLIIGTPCPECGEPYYWLPYCEKCGWYDKECDEREKERIKLLWGLYDSDFNKKDDKNGT